MAQQVSGRQPRYKRILLKLSGEALMGSEEFGIDPKVLDRMALEVGQLVGIGVQVGLVIGGGNLFRGAALSAAGMDRVTGDHMGMLAIASFSWGVHLENSLRAVCSLLTVAWRCFSASGCARGKPASVLTKRLRA